jgi:hypothetical protein
LRGCRTFRRGQQSSAGARIPAVSPRPTDRHQTRRPALHFLGEIFEIETGRTSPKTEIMASQGVRVATVLLADFAEAPAARLAELLRARGNSALMGAEDHGLSEHHGPTGTSVDLIILGSSKGDSHVRNRIAEVHRRCRDRYGMKPPLLCVSTAYRGARFELDIERAGARIVYMSGDDFRPVAEKADVILLERSDLMRIGPRFLIIHRFRAPGTDCAPGEEIAAVSLIFRGRETPVRLPLALRLLFDYLARYRHMPQSATQIAAGMRAAVFFQEHGANSGVLSLRKIARSSVKEYVKQIRNFALPRAFRKVHPVWDPKRVLVSEETAGNEILYRLQAMVEWSHPEEPYTANL